ncbi:MAG: hypothetical protein HZB41_05930 [Ignavibacteriae bacterium]|nr:hypothetical protein [Ignavibacteriota bacterium]
MELIIAILWYLQLLVPGVNYTQSDLNVLMQNNQKAVQDIRKDGKQSNMIMNCYNSNSTKNVSNLIEEWTDPPPEPIMD